MVATRPTSRPVAVGDNAPDFTLPDSQGRPVRLSDHFGRECVVLYFYPRDSTPTCTKQACHFRDAWDDLTQAGAAVIGVSSSSAQAHEAFAARHHLPFTLLSDARGEVRRLYGVPRTLGFLPGRTTYVIDRAGVVRHIFSSQFQPQAHVDEALRIVRMIYNETQPQPDTPGR